MVRRQKISFAEPKICGLVLSRRTSCQPALLLGSIRLESLGTLGTRRAPFSVLEADAFLDVFAFFQFAVWLRLHIVCERPKMKSVPSMNSNEIRLMFVKPLPCGGTDFLLWKSYLREEPVSILVSYVKS